jgi:pectinesterase
VFALALVAVLQQNPAANASAVVAADGSGQYRTVQEAINAAPQDTSADRRWVIFVLMTGIREGSRLIRHRSARSTLRCLNRRAPSARPVR